MAKAKKAANKAVVEGGATIELARLKDAVIEIPIVGLTPVIPHRWSEKAKRMMPGHPDKPTTKQVKEKRDPQAEAEACLYKIPGSERLGLPATAFKAAMVDAVRLFEGLTIVESKSLFSVVGEGDGGDQLTPIEGEKELHEDTPRNSNGNADLRYRYYITGWSATIRVRYMPERISRESIVALLDAAGRGGVGDWRPSAPKSKTGTYGTWRVDETKEVRDVA